MKWWWTSMRVLAGACATAGVATPPAAAAPSPSAATPPARKLRRSSPGPLAVMVGSQPQTQPLIMRREDVLNMVFPPGLRGFMAAVLGFRFAGFVGPGQGLPKPCRHA